MNIIPLPIDNERSENMAQCFETWARQIREHPEYFMRVCVVLETRVDEDVGNVAPYTFGTDTLETLGLLDAAKFVVWAQAK